MLIWAYLNSIGDKYLNQPEPGQPLTKKSRPRPNVEKRWLACIRAGIFFWPVIPNLVFFLRVLEETMKTLRQGMVLKRRSLTKKKIPSLKDRPGINCYPTKWPGAVCSRSLQTQIFSIDSQINIYLLRHSQGWVDLAPPFFKKNIKAWWWQTAKQKKCSLP